jgi:phage N-6-adenine-methyltransferase
MTHKHRPSNGDDEYATPPWLWRKLARAVDGFDLDPASGAESTPIADTRFTREDDGLSKAWHGDVWLNPPFGDASSTGRGGREKWLTKARNEVNRDDVRTVTVLLPVDTSTSWFHKHVVEADTICFMDSRIEFEGEQAEETGNTSFATYIAVFGDVPDRLTDALESLGAVFRGRDYYRSTVQPTLTGVR